MSDRLAAAAAALEAPEHLVERSAAARAAAAGSTTESVLAAWAGDAPLPAAPPSSAPAEEVSAPPPAAAPAAAASPAPAAAPAPAPADAPVAAPPPSARSTATPILVGRPYRWWAAWLAILGLTAIAVMATMVVPARTGGDFTHLVGDPVLGAPAQAGREIYLREGCWYCHTQLVRPVLADVGLGPATETYTDSLKNASFGIRRIGPDLSRVGGRPAYGDEEGTVTATRMRDFLAHPGAAAPGALHPSYAYLSDRDLDSLTAYLTEMK